VDAYAAVFTEDAVLDVAGQVRKGRQQIRDIVVGLQKSRAAAEAGTRRPPRSTT
jgi:ketosteroid isomerase-like protein